MTSYQTGKQHATMEASMRDVIPDWQTVTNSGGTHKRRHTRLANSMQQWRHLWETSYQTGKQHATMEAPMRDIILDWQTVTNNGGTHERIIRLANSNQQWRHLWEKSYQTGKQQPTMEAPMRDIIPDWQTVTNNGGTNERHHTRLANSIQ